MPHLPTIHLRDYDHVLKLSALDAGRYEPVGLTFAVQVQGAPRRVVDACACENCGADLRARSSPSRDRVVCDVCDAVYPITFKDLTGRAGAAPVPTTRSR